MAGKEIIRTAVNIRTAQHRLHGSSNGHCSHIAICIDGIQETVVVVFVLEDGIPVIGPELPAHAWFHRQHLLMHIIQIEGHAVVGRKNFQRGGSAATIIQETVVRLVEEDGAITQSTRQQKALLNILYCRVVYKQYQKAAMHKFHSVRTLFHY